MPKGPEGQKRPADVVSNTVHVMRVLTGEADQSLLDEQTKRLRISGGESIGVELSPANDAPGAPQGEDQRGEK
jgi:hypothetical protein